MSAYEQRIEPPDRRWQYLLFAAEPYETIAFKVSLYPISATNLFIYQLILILFSSRFLPVKLTRARASSGLIGTKMPGNCSFNFHLNWMVANLLWLPHLLLPEFLARLPICLLHLASWVWPVWLHHLHLDKCTILWANFSFKCQTIFFYTENYTKHKRYSWSKSLCFRWLDGGCVSIVQEINPTDFGYFLRTVVRYRTAHLVPKLYLIAK